ncbi:hypothetical protein B9479_008351, partial [Cryptococcus floricola]
MRKEFGKLHNLVDLPHQHALLLLQLCLQQNIRHLQRSLKTDDFGDEWKKMDERLWEEVQRLQMRQRGNSQVEEAKGRLLSSLPARFGGLGLLSFNKIAPLAYKSAQESADSFLANIDLIHPLDPPPNPTPQRVRCAKLWSDQLSSFMETASQPERKHLAENASKIGRSWLRQIPYIEPLRLSNHEVAA